MRTVRKLHDAGWKHSYFTSAGIYMLGHGCGVSQYPHFFIDSWMGIKCYRRVYFEGFPGHNFVKEKWVLELVDKAVYLSHKVLNKY